MNTESPKSNVQSRQTASGPPRSPKSFHGFRGDGKDAFHRVPRNISSDGTQWNAPLPTFDLSGALGTARPTFGFTLIEIAICLAVIGFALVAIIGILPM